MRPMSRNIRENARICRKVINSALLTQLPQPIDLTTPEFDIDVTLDRQPSDGKAQIVRESKQLPTEDFRYCFKFSFHEQSARNFQTKGDP